MINISIIGTANRDCSSNVTKELFHKMCFKSEEIINSLNVDLKNINLISGKSSFSDHVAIYLYSTGKYGGLTLYLPCKWNSIDMIFEGNNSSFSINKYHKNFSKTMGYNTLQDIEIVKRNDAIIYDENDGFFQRNTLVAKSEYLIVFTFANDDKSISGGSKDTWKKCKGKKLHINLNIL